MMQIKSTSIIILIVSLFKTLLAFPFLATTQQKQLSLSRTQRKATTTNIDDSDEATNCFDLVVIGAGPVGVKAAILAATQYLNATSEQSSVGLIDSAPPCSSAGNNLGNPTGLFSKALRDCSKNIQVDSLRGMGLRDDSIWNEIRNSCVDLTKFNSDDTMKQLGLYNNRIQYLQGFASFQENNDEKLLKLNILQKKPSTSSVEKETTTIQTITTKNVLLATGSKPFRPSNIPFDDFDGERRIFDSDTINTLSYLPTSLAITGSGIIAIEYAKIFNSLGVDVTLIIRDINPRGALMKIGLDVDIAASLVADLIRSGIKIIRGTEAISFDVPTSSSSGSTSSLNRRKPITLKLKASASSRRQRNSSSQQSEDENSSNPTKELKCDAYLAAVGRTPNTAKLNLQAANIQVDDYGGLIVDDTLCTTAKGRNVYGAGDVLGRPFLASTGVAQAVAALQAMFDPSCSTNDDKRTSTAAYKENDESCVETSVLTKLGSGTMYYNPKSLESNPFAFPIGIWSSPEVAYYGLSKNQATTKFGIPKVGEGVALYSQCLRGLVFHPNGVLKLVYDKTTQIIIGVHICGDDACELIHYGMELVKSQRTIQSVANEFMFSAVTYHEMYRIAALAAMDEIGSRQRRALAGAALSMRNRQDSKK